MIYLTGDVHFYDRHNWEQKKVGSEVKASKKYLEILKKHKIKCTLFLNGKCLKKETEGIRELLNFDVELGGHTYDNFKNLGKIKSFLSRKIWGCIYGSSGYQEKDIQKTKKEFEKKGLKMISWRTHAFGSNKETFRILSRNGVKFVSDLLGDQKPFREGGAIHLPINIPVDQNTIAYGILDPRNRNPFASCTKGRIEPEEWFEIVKTRIIKNEKAGVPSILLIHPATMAALDDFALFERIAKFLERYKSGKVSEFKL